jgi:D-alanyl-D-alanine carboxypeptidase/D-alanyl-D-alanine-endopeptidase (penicillin-binding protein 4)
MKQNVFYIFIIFVLFTTASACKSKHYFETVKTDHIEKPVIEQHIDTISIVKDTQEIVDEWVDLPEKTGSFQNQLGDQIKNSKILRHGFSGFMLYDLNADTLIYSINEHKYFVSASNTKIFTLYACLKTMQDSIAAFKYVETDSSLVLWGTADPTLLHPYFEDYSILNFLKIKSKNKKTVNLANNNTLLPYGRGWMWDDYNDSYQAEIAAMPIYGNVLSVKQENNTLAIVPSSSLMSFNIDSKIPYVIREWDQNRFTIPSSVNVNAYFSQEIPYKNASKLNVSLLSDILREKIDTIQMPLPVVHQTKYSWPIDTVLRRMMYKSDNMLAEHLLLNAAMQSIDTLNTSVFIKWIKDSYLSDLPQKLFWIDGSGLSRYNRFTPQDVIYILQKLFRENDKTRLFSFFNKIETSASTGTQKFKEKPLIYAKSGSMSGVYNLSGYIISKNGRVLAYSFMNNNFDVAIRDVRSSINKILNYIVENY